MNWIEVVGWTGSTILVISLLQARVLRLRLINLIGSLVLLTYNAIIEVWPMVGLNAVLSLINIVYLWRMLRARHDAAAYTVLEVKPDDRYLQHVLRVHGQDIARYNPQFPGEVAPEEDAYLVVLGDETVGVVLTRDAGEGIAEVVLDYVTQRHRDFSPGEFVFRESGLFARRGYRRVLSPAGMKNPYYQRIGFRPEGGRWVLDV
ncbi:YgjV family protein [Ornithinimicrobium pratense]|uniref:YgjV family protein n=1 Tax=Ornithinimicrobium pratense TaxID=2593973 RepID=A0A5J6V9D9_9MICO|nr:YgjV family protein [Ornithinimicrobium pratense]QFG69642.1 YgjV family protein [Ornithinimicrobium pratense]